jgi:filamentous hemagglutinin family protein
MGSYQPFLPGLVSLGIVLLVSPVYGQSITTSPDGTQTQVDQAGSDYSITGGTRAGDNLFHSFSEFNLLNGESATFLTDPGTLNVLGRVTGGNASVIDGLLNVSGSSANLFLLNPAGILFGANAALNLGGSFTATTADGITFGTGDFAAIGSNDYSALVGEPTGFTFSETPGSVVNGGNLAVSPGETLQLIGGQVINTGTLTAPEGEIIIAAVEGGNWVRIAQDGLVLNLELATLPDNSGAPLPFTPLALPELLTGSGLSDAIAVMVNPDGTVNLTGSDVPIPAQPGIAIASGVLQAAGGQVDVLGSTVALIDSLIDVSGEFGGGQIRVGGDYLGSGPVPNAQVTYVDENSLLQADATVDGDGGRIILWSDQTTRTYGNLSARGGLLGGDGGFIETSSAGYLDVPNAPDVSAPNGNGGSWLIDPHNITIGGTISDTFTIDPTFGAFVLTAITDDAVITRAAIENFFNISGGQLTISTGTTGTQAGNITINEDLDFAAAGTLVLDAAGDVNLTSSISSAVTPLNISVTAGGSIIFDSIGAFTIDSDGGDINFSATNIQIGGAAPGLQTIDAGAGDINLTASNAGVLVDISGVLNTTTGTINLNGTSIGGDGIEVLGDVTTTTGTINLTGSGAIDGVKLAGGDVATDGGTINLNGTGGVGFGVEIQILSGFGADPTNLNVQGTSSAGTSINSAVDFTTFGGNLSLTQILHQSR